ncbi:hypothetical protein DN757_00565 [Paenibacillus silvae]|uniref:Uncharacterized protein n=1 Tax=Paenibacillus silvae TaxID=1325358 RepID=A0A2W6PHT6_9BACL|nr:hypothetical protein DN757_00565 [Paenibacillus silvae]
MRGMLFDIHRDVPRFRERTELGAAFPAHFHNGLEKPDIRNIKLYSIKLVFESSLLHSFGEIFLNPN